MREISVFSVLAVVIAFAAPSFGQELSELQHQSHPSSVFVALPSSRELTGLLHRRLQIEGSFATIFKGDAGYNLNVNYAPPLPGALDHTVAIGAFWQWTFNADNLERVGGSNPNAMKLGGEIRLQKAFLNGSLVPYIKGEVEWVRFDNDESINKFGVGPGFGINFWITPNYGFGSEFNTVFLFKRSDAPEKQINTLLVGPRIRF